MWHFKMELELHRSCRNKERWKKSNVEGMERDCEPSRIRWRVDVKKTASLYWIRVTQDCDHWRKLGNAYVQKWSVRC